eukprot:7199941-Pyramimonas_sp.AAC.2
MALDIQATSTTVESLSIGQKFQKAYYLFFPEADPRSRPREVVKVCLPLSSSTAVPSPHTLVCQSRHVYFPYARLRTRFC